MPMICCIKASGKWQYGNMAAWRYGNSKRIAKNVSRQIVQLQLKPAQSQVNFNAATTHVYLHLCQCVCVCVLILAASGMATFVASMGRPLASLHNFYTMNALATFLLLKKMGWGLHSRPIARSRAIDSVKWLSCLFDKLMWQVWSFCWHKRCYDIVENFQNSKDEQNWSEKTE